MIDTYKAFSKKDVILDYESEINNKKEMHNTIFNCYKNQIRKINKLNGLKNDIQGI